MAVTSSPRNDIMLAASGVIIGVACAAGYGAWSAVNETGAPTADRWSTFGDAMLFPGALIVVLVTVMVWLGWKANIDG